MNMSCSSIRLPGSTTTHACTRLPLRSSSSSASAAARASSSTTGTSVAFALSFALASRAALFARKFDSSTLRGAILYFSETYTSSGGGGGGTGGCGSEVLVWSQRVMVAGA